MGWWRSLLGVGVLAQILMAPVWADTAKGTVFLDANGNGLRDAGEEGVPGVCVSNGQEVARTDESGAWHLPVGNDTALFVIKPSGFAVPVDEHHLPRYYYLHKPAGSPASKSPVLGPTGALPDSIDFPLTRSDETKPFSVVLFGDPQARGLREVNFIAHDAVEELIGTDAAFGITLGDVVADDPALFGEISGCIGQIGIPWYCVFGNHDHNRDLTEDHLKDETFERFFGPSTYAFEYGRAAFVVFNNIYSGVEGGRGYGFAEAQIEFITGYLAFLPKDRLVVLLMHVPLPVCDNREALYRVLEGRPRTFSVAAHTHEMAHLWIDADHGWRGTTPHHHFISPTVSGSWWCGLQDELGIPHATMNDGAPNGYTFLDIDGADYALRFKAARRPASYQMNIYAPDEVEASAVAETVVQANVFAGSEKSEVAMRLGAEGPWLPMDPVRDIDPEVLRMHQLSPILDQKADGRSLEEIFGWKMDYPSKTRHMWQARLPKDPAPGTYTITVRARDMFGHVHTGRRIIRVR